MRKRISSCGGHGGKREAVGSHLADAGRATILGVTIPALMIHILHIHLHDHAPNIRTIARQDGANGLQPRHHEGQHEHDRQ